MRILFICHGNIHRSTMAQCVMQHLLDKAGLSDDVVIDSAAISGEQEGEWPAPMTFQTLIMHDIPTAPIINHTSREISYTDTLRFDLFLCMTKNQIDSCRTVLGKKAEIHRLLDYTDSPRDIDDPYLTNEYELVFKEILEGCTALLNELKCKKGMQQ